jgi:hypothetical protein
VTVRWVPGAGHLFEDHLEELQDHIRSFFTRGGGARALSEGPAMAGGDVLGGTEV